MNEFFAKIAKAISAAVGSPIAFIIAFGAAIIWVISGPLFKFSSNWQLVINTGTTVVTFLMVFIIQNAQNRHQTAIQLKLDELLRATSDARTGFANIENLDDETLKRLGGRSESIHEMNAADVKEALEDEFGDAETSA